GGPAPSREPPCRECGAWWISQRHIAIGLWRHYPRRVEWGWRPVGHQGALPTLDHGINRSGPGTRYPCGGPNLIVHRWVPCAWLHRPRGPRLERLGRPHRTVRTRSLRGREELRWPFTHERLAGSGRALGLLRRGWSGCG